MKEYGEGVDRMCRELGGAGLPGPVFDNSSFILKTIVISASFAAKTTVSASVPSENASIHEKDALIELLKGRYILNVSE